MLSGHYTVRRKEIPMQKVNKSDVTENHWESPKGKFGCFEKELSIALGLNLDSRDTRSHHPFDFTMCRVIPGKANWPYHSHSAQWEFYHIISGSGQVRHKEGYTDIEEGDAFLFGPDEAHQLINNGATDLLYYVVADNPAGESSYYPDSKKWHIRDARDQIVRSNAIDYLDGEE